MGNYIKVGVMVDDMCIVVDCECCYEVVVDVLNCFVGVLGGVIDICGSMKVNCVINV